MNATASVCGDKVFISTIINHDGMPCGSSTSVFITCFATAPNPDGTPKVLWRTRVDGIFHESIPAIHGDGGFILSLVGFLCKFQ